MALQETPPRPGWISVLLGPPLWAVSVRRGGPETTSDRFGGYTATMITRLDFIGIPSQDADRARGFYRDTLGLRPDEHGH